MDDIRARGRTPLLVGGTMLYIKALMEGLDDMPAADPQVRAQLLMSKCESKAPSLACRTAAG